ncbi:ribosomal protein L32 [Petrotoga mobilis SJ95]|jgi:large subunit ribosomal protein L32|uniref:Large ribosomal subunit protein bL32 n=1 Tax=Petrotoga mobilis (strain DSM 10674 / SJ95) TaxID=403833 RepID=RL32_PETMO|nr:MULTISPECIES: 50S ribosomal protein L32 [Petrotoga]A9BGV2.1 RecName: Full=Large ribosomal subunit protein bL32; AltName: Full=50S ribosomal protein L32 [Petrotoga mobilis SJ95]MDK2812703.1 large subunit ribosomal protein [Petrotoga sp.]ABX32533.1 ribosomal protein L32 [Petrotoga mobilis SJ95]MBL5981231.1 50S ribosomal protein L32 [Petrotoga sp. 8T1HF07.NaAc.6.1]PNR87867.1 50S ribosomal protein L32 [Petrotoga sp. 9T1HF07.CasAA.8.2]PNR91306.1 50S ribosomal protein L32 [Petrotoga sp. HWHPT.55
MATPKQKASRGQTHSRRAKFYSAYKINVVKCPKCGEPKLPHRVCLNCGYYGDKQILEIGE